MTMAYGSSWISTVVMVHTVYKPSAHDIILPSSSWFFITLYQLTRLDESCVLTHADILGLSLFDGVGKAGVGDFFTFYLL